MSISDIPKPVIGIIYQFLNYNERCHFRATCRYLSRFANKEPLKYWILRDDPICLNLVGNALIMVKLQYGIYVDLRNVSILTSEALIMNKLIFVGGNIEAYKNRGNLQNNCYPDIYAAFKHGHFELVELIKKDIYAYPTAGYAKYSLINKNFENISQYAYQFSEDYMYYLMLRFNVPKLYRENIPARYHAKIKFAIKTCNFNAVKLLITVDYKCDVLHSFLVIACKKNYIEIVKLLFIELSKRIDFSCSMFYKDFEDVCRLKDRQILITILSCYDPFQNYLNIKIMATKCKYSLIKKLIL